MNHLVVPLIILLISSQSVPSTMGASTTTGLDSSPTIDFENDVMPLFTKHGCNAGACHGAAVGRGGFKLSLYGGNPNADHEAIVQQLEGRRVNLVYPSDSLLLEKPTLGLKHGGGLLFDAESESALILRNWIRQGAEAGSRRTLERLEISPDSYNGNSTNESIPLRAVAYYRDGTALDVTRWTVFKAEDPSAITIDQRNARAQVNRPGRHLLIARYLEYVNPIELIVPLSAEPLALDDIPRHNFIDVEVLRTLKTLRIPPSPTVDDSGFLRRVTLDLTGKLPAPNVVDVFLNDPSPTKRQDLVERLLESDDFDIYWTYQLAKLFRVRPQQGDPEGAPVYYAWLRNQVEQETGYHELVRTVLLADGDTHTHGPPNFYRSVNGPREQAEFVSELFLGTRLRCANCHDHPLDRWTQDDYHGLAAIFAKVKRSRVIEANPSGNVIHPATLEPATPRIPGDRFIQSEPGDERLELTNWLTSVDNPYFAKAIVNRLWRHLMGRGLVEPVDDFRATNPPTHPELLEQLAADFIEHDYQLQHTLRVIATSSTYSRSSLTTPENRTDVQFYSHALKRPLEPEVLADAFTDVLGVTEPYGETTLGTRAVTLVDPEVASRSLDVLGRCDRETSCEGATNTTPGLPRSLHLFNGRLLNDRIGTAGSRLDQLLQSGIPPLEIVDQFYTAAFSRHLNDRERVYWSEQVCTAQSKTEQRAVLEDIIWGLLASTEFGRND